MDFEDFLSNLKKLADKERAKIQHFPLRSEAEKELKNFLTLQAKRPFKENDLVERNEMGIERYSMPKDNQVAMVVKLLDEPKFGDDYEDMIIAVAIAKGIFRFFSVNSAYYQKTTAANNATYTFRERGERLDG